MKRFYLICFIALIAIVAFLRLYRFEGFVTFLGDQGRDAIIVKRILTLEHLPAIGAPSSVGQVYLGPFYYYLIAPFLLIFNFNPVGLAYGVAFLSIIGISLSLLIIRKETNLFITLFFGLLLAFSFPLIELARFSWNPNLLPFFAFLTIYFYYRWITKLKAKDSILFGTFFAFSFQLHYLAFFMFPTFTFFYIYQMWKSKKKRRLLVQTSFAFLSFLFFASPLIIFDFRHNFLNSKNFLALLQTGGITSGSAYNFRLIDTIQFFITHSTQISLNQISAVSILLLVLVLGLVIIKKYSSLFAGIHLANIIFYLLGFALLQSPRHLHYFGPVYVSFYLLISYLLLPIRDKILQTVIGALLLVGFISLNAPRYYFLTENPNNQIGHSRIVADFLLQKTQGKPFNIATWPVEFGEDPYLYFMEIKGARPADRRKIEIADQMFVICEKEPCLVIDSPSWNISMFGSAEIADTWDIEGLRIYKLVHLFPST